MSILLLTDKYIGYSRMSTDYTNYVQL